MYKLYKQLQLASHSASKPRPTLIVLENESYMNLGRSLNTA